MYVPTQSHRDLIVWQRAVQFAVAMYALTSQFPSNQQFSLVQQMQRSAISIASNIAEGRHRSSRKEFLRFLKIAYASGAELETQIIIAKNIPLTKVSDFHSVDRLLLETMKMLNSMMSKLKAQ